MRGEMSWGTAVDLFVEVWWMLIHSVAFVLPIVMVMALIPIAGRLIIGRWFWE